MNKLKTKSLSKTQTTLSAFFSEPKQSVKNIKEKPSNNIRSDPDISSQYNEISETNQSEDIFNNLSIDKKYYNLNVCKDTNPLKQINDSSNMKSDKKILKSKREEDNCVTVSKRLKLPSPNEKIVKKTPDNEDILDGFFDDICKNLDEIDDSFWGNLELPDSKIESNENLDLSQWQSCIILDYTEDSFQYILKLKSTLNESVGKCTLKDFWTNTIIEINNIVSVIAVKDENNQFCVTNRGGFIVLWPDNLISGTEIVNSLFCTRKSVLQDHFKGIDSGNKSMMIGNLIHELFQFCIVKKICKVNEIRVVSETILRKPQFLYMLYELNLTHIETLSEIDKFIPQISKFVGTYILKIGSPPNVFDKKNKMWEGTIENILDIEENIWSPKFGISGRIDATVKVKIYDRKTNKSNNKIMPLELKTGKASNSSEHRGQVILYTMLLTEIIDESDELKNDINEGLLLYLRDSITVHEITATYTERRDLILLRNKLAHYMEQWKKNITNKIVLPEPINHHSACEKCPYLTLCSLYLSRNSDLKLSENHLLVKLKQEAIGHLSSDDIDYFLHWCKLLMIEENEGNEGNRRKDLWTVPVDIREKKGKCLSNMSISSVSINNSCFEHTFKKNGEYSDFNISSTLLLPEEYIVISSSNRYAVASGTITNITANSISVLLSRDLMKRNSYSTKFTLDSFESQFIVSYNLTSLSLLMENTESSNRLRRIIVDKKVPELNEKIPKSSIEKVKDILSELNSVQQSAILKSLISKDYFLIRGMPGTGKTQTLIALVEVLVKLNMSVLITSHTHSAVDNIFLRLKDKQIKMLRLGSSSKIHKQIQFCSESQVIKDSKTTDDLNAIFMNTNVVGVTCLGSNHPLLIKRTFDICIIDESTQVLQCSVIRPLLAANKFILVGDPDQLPPIVKSPEARILGFDESLFYRLDKLESTISLNLQYRMNKTIMELANRLTYKNQLKCANETVSTATINIDFADKTFQNVNKLAKTCLSSCIEDSVIILDTGNTYDKCKDSDLYNLYDDEIDNHKYNNICEAIIISNFIKILLKASIKKSQIGVIAPYRDQIALLKKVISKLICKSYLNDETDIEINTVDQYQGRDKDIILYSCTKTQSKEVVVQDNKENQILEDKRRLTVAITRAKRKLVVIGDISTLKMYKPFKELFDICMSDVPIGKLVSLPLMESNNDFSWKDKTDF